MSYQPKYELGPKTFWGWWMIVRVTIDSTDTEQRQVIAKVWNKTQAMEIVKRYNDYPKLLNKLAEVGSRYLKLKQRIRADDPTIYAAHIHSIDQALDHLV